MIDGRATIHLPMIYRFMLTVGRLRRFFHLENTFVSSSLLLCSRRTIFLADKTPVISNRHGDVGIPFDRNSLCLRNALYVPSLGSNLVSTGRLADHGIESLYRRHDMHLKLRTVEPLLVTANEASKVTFTLCHNLALHILQQYRLRRLTH